MALREALMFTMVDLKNLMVLMEITMSLMRESRLQSRKGENKNF